MKTEFFSTKINLDYPKSERKKKFQNRFLEGKWHVDTFKDLKFVTNVLNAVLSDK